MEQTRLFRLAVEAVAITAHFHIGQGWSVTISTRRGDETWQEAAQQTYACLSTDELVDVIDATLALELGG